MLLVDELYNTAIVQTKSCRIDAVLMVGVIANYK